MVKRLIVLALCATIVFSSEPCFAGDADKTYGGKTEKEMPGRSVEQLNEIMKGKEAVISEKAIVRDKFKEEYPQRQDSRVPLIEYFEDGRIAKMTIVGVDGKPADIYIFDEKGKDLEKSTDKEKAPPMDTKEPPKSKLDELPKLDEPPVYSRPKLNLGDILEGLGQYFGLPTKKPVKTGTPKFSPVLERRQRETTRRTPTDYNRIIFRPYFNGGSVISVRVERTETQTLMEN